MGTTVTTNHGLIKPDGNEKVKEDLPFFNGWADQNADNCDVIDGLFRHSTHSYTPVWTADAGNPTFGAGSSISGKYVRLFPKLVYGQFKMLTGGAGFLPGTGLYEISLPPVAFPPEFSTYNDSVPVGKAYLHDNSAVINCTVMVTMYNIATNKFFFRKDTGDAWRSTTPFTMDQQDRLSGYFMFPTATP